MTRILVISDLHVGSIFGLALPEDYDQDNDVTYHANDIGCYFFDKWCEMRNTIGHVDITIVNGDVVDGSNSKNSGAGLYTSDIHSQAVMATKLLNMIDSDTFLFTDGSAYHTGRFKGGISGDQLVCDMVGGSWLGLWDIIKVKGISIHVQHYENTTSVPYSRCTAQQKNAFIMEAQATPSDIYIRSHTHKFAGSFNSKSLTIGTPCWKGIDEFIGRQKQELPDNGYVILDVDNNDYDFKYHIFNVPFKFYKKGEIVF